MLLNASQNIHVTTKYCLELNTWSQVCINRHLLLFKPSYLHSAIPAALLVCQDCPRQVNCLTFSGAKVGGAEGFFTNILCSEKAQPFSF